MKDTTKKDAFVVMRKRRNYTSEGEYPKISIKREMFDRLADVANESGLSMSEIAGQALRFALDRLEWVEE